MPTVEYKLPCQLCQDHFRLIVTHDITWPTINDAEQAFRAASEGRPMPQNLKLDDPDKALDVCPESQASGEPHRIIFQA